MLVLTRKANESIIIDGDIRVTVLLVRSNQVRIGIEAPVDVSIFREEFRPPTGPVAATSRTVQPSALTCSPAFDVASGAGAR